MGIRNRNWGALVLAGLWLAASALAQQRPISQKGIAGIQREVRHQLVLLPDYSVFDNLAFKVDDNGHVTLLGQVTQPTLKSEAENVVTGIEGVTGVTNNLQVLPLSPSDDRIRLAEYRAIFSQPSLQRYGMEAVPPIHIIVDNGHVTLVGIVDNQGDKTMAEMAARQVPGVFSVKDDLQVEKQQAK